MNAFRSLLLLLALLGAAAARAEAVTYFRVAGVTGGIALAPDGNLWFPTVGAIVRMTPAGEMTKFPVATPIGAYSTIAAGPDGRMWVTSSSGARLYAVTMTGVVTEYPLPAGSHPRGITSGPDGNVWFGYAAGVGRITPAGAITYFPLAQPREVVGIVEGPDGNLWFVQWPFTRVGRITPAGAVTYFSSPLGIPVAISRGAGGSLWLAFNSGRAIARLSTDGTMEPHYPVGTAGDGYRGAPRDVAAGPDATIWFSTEMIPRVGRIRPNGEVVVVDLPPNVPEVAGMAAGPDGNQWVVVRPPGRGCALECPPPDPAPPIGIARINLVAPAVHNVPIPTLSGGSIVLMALVLAVVALVAMRGTFA